MHAHPCELARRTLIQALSHRGTLALFASGQVPNPGYHVRFDRSLPGVVPPQFARLQQQGSGISVHGMTPYAVSQLFALGAYRETIVVAHADGHDEVSVEAIAEPPEVGVTELAPGISSVPYVLPPSATGSSHGSTTASGYSRRFDFSEALAEAIAALPPPTEVVHPDDLTRVTVLEVGVELGGVAGFHHLFVRVRREPTHRHSVDLLRRQLHSRRGNVQVAAQ